MSQEPVTSWKKWLDQQPKSKVEEEIIDLTFLKDIPHEKISLAVINSIKKQTLKTIENQNKDYTVTQGLDSLRSRMLSKTQQELSTNQVKQTSKTNIALVANFVSSLSIPKPEILPASKLLSFRFQTAKKLLDDFGLKYFEFSINNAVFGKPKTLAVFNPIRGSQFKTDKYTRVDSESLQDWEGWEDFEKFCKDFAINQLNIYQAMTGSNWRILSWSGSSVQNILNNLSSITNNAKRVMKFLGFSIDLDNLEEGLNSFFEWSYNHLLTERELPNLSTLDLKKVLKWKSSGNFVLTNISKESWKQPNGSATPTISDSPFNQALYTVSLKGIETLEDGRKKTLTEQKSLAGDILNYVWQKAKKEHKVEQPVVPSFKVESSSEWKELVIKTANEAIYRLVRTGPDFMTNLYDVCFSFTDSTDISANDRSVPVKGIIMSARTETVTLPTSLKIQTHTYNFGSRKLQFPSSRVEKSHKSSLSVRLDHNLKVFDYTSLLEGKKFRVEKQTNMIPKNLIGFLDTQTKKAKDLSIYVLIWQNTNRNNMFFQKPSEGSEALGKNNGQALTLKEPPLIYVFEGVRFLGPSGSLTLSNEGGTKRVQRFDFVFKRDYWVRNIVNSKETQESLF